MLLSHSILELSTYSIHSAHYWFTCHTTFFYYSALIPAALWTEFINPLPSSSSNFLPNFIFLSLHLPFCLVFLSILFHRNYVTSLHCIAKHNSYSQVNVLFSATFLYRAFSPALTAICKFQVHPQRLWSDRCRYDGADVFGLHYSMISFPLRLFYARFSLKETRWQTFAPKFNSLSSSTRRLLLRKYLHKMFPICLR